MLNNFNLFIVLLILSEISVVDPPPAPPEFKQRFNLSGKKRSYLCFRYVIILFPTILSVIFLLL